MNIIAVCTELLWLIHLHGTFMEQFCMNLMNLSVKGAKLLCVLSKYCLLGAVV